MTVYWLSFCDGKRPKGLQFLGGVFLLITAETLAALPTDRDLMGYLCTLAWRLGCNPGGEMMAQELLPSARERFPSLDRRYSLRGRLLDRDESNRRWAELLERPN